MRAVLVALAILLLSGFAPAPAPSAPSAATRPAREGHFSAAPFVSARDSVLDASSTDSWHDSVLNTPSSGPTRSPVAPASSITTHHAAPTGTADRTWLVLPAPGGVAMTRDGGATWSTRLRGLPARGSFFGLVLDPARTGTAYVYNGDVYRTSDGGLTWMMLPGPPAAQAPAGITALTVDARTGAVFAGGRGVSERGVSDRAWRTWGRGWPLDQAPSFLVTAQGGVLYAAAGSRLLRLTGQNATWQQMVTPRSAGDVTALAIAPDGINPLVAYSHAGVWYGGGGTTLHKLGSLFPDDEPVTAIADDPTGAKVYAAVRSGVYSHDPFNAANGELGNAWTLSLAASPRDPFVALLSGRDTLRAVSAGGAVWRLGPSVRTWQRERVLLTGSDVAIAVAANGMQWHLPPPPVQLPAAFTQDCLPIGPGPGEEFGVCGPISDFYTRNGRNAVFGWPLGRAGLDAHGVVSQPFQNAILEWRADRGVYLAPLGRLAAGGVRFPHPTASEIAANQFTTVYLNGYLVDPRLYQFWRSHTDDHGVSIFGPPLSQMVEVSSTDGTGRRVLAQYFENARLEWYPDGRIRLSSLGHL